MKLFLLFSTVISLLLTLTSMAHADPQQDLLRYQNYFKKKFPQLTPVDLSNGMYNFNKDKKQQWNDIMEFPPYEIAVEEGEALFNTSFKNGNTYAGCFDNGGIAIAHTYPRFELKTGKVKTLAGAINACRKRNNEKPLKYLKGELVSVLAYMANTSRGKPISVSIPNEKEALAAYNDGKRIYFTRRGPRAFACYHCHWQASGSRIRGNELSPAVGQASHFPTYRSKWGGMGTIQRRYKGCMKNIGAKPLKEQTEAMNNLEYFHTFLSNGIPMNAPGTRF